MKQKILNTIGILFILLGVAGIIVNINTQTLHFLIWFCNNTSFIIGAAILFRSRFWLTAELSIAFFPQILWSIDFLSKLFFDKFIFGFTDYMFFPSYPKALYILSWNHLFILPVALIVLYYMGKPVKDAWKGSAIHGAIILIPSFLLSSLGNINCVTESCIFFIPTNLAYKILWPPLFFLLIVIPTNYLIVWFFKKYQ